MWAALLSRRPMKADGVTGRSPCKRFCNFEAQQLYE